MWINRQKYNNLLKCLDEALCNNYELRKVCHCQECKWCYTTHGYLSSNRGSDNFNETMSPYGSCEKCERR